MPQDNEDRLQDVSLRYFDHLENQIQLVATKATLLVAAAAIVLGGYLDYAKDTRIFPLRGGMGALANLGFAAGGVMLLVALGAAMWSIWPKMHEPGTHRLFYGWISANDKATFLKHYNCLGHADTLQEELANRIYGKACWLRHMYIWIRISLGCLMAGAVLTALVIVLSTPGADAPAGTATPAGAGTANVAGAEGNK